MLSDSERRAVQELEADLLADPEFARSMGPVERLLERLAAPVVVGVGHEPDSSPALAWAATEAAAQRRPLRILHAFWSPVLVDPFGTAPSLDSLVTQQAAAAAVVDRALARVRSIAPHLEVSASIVRDTPRRLLLRESRTARLLVVGSRRGGPPSPGLARLLCSPLAPRLTASAACPVAVVHPPAPRDGAPLRVVVGIDRLTCPDAVGFAFRAAAQRGLPVTAVHAWTGERSGGGLMACEADAYELLDAAVSPWQAMYPRVPLVRHAVRRDPATALIAGSAGAALVVVGTRGHRARHGASVSVSRAVVDGAAGPVAVVRAGCDS